MNESPSPNYDVGYGKPPAKNQFKKGQSGNPNGRPKQPEGISITEILNGKQYGKNGEAISSREALVISLLKNASQGFRQVLDAHDQVWVAPQRNASAGRPNHPLPNRSPQFTFTQDVCRMATKERTT
jgi:Family of unknown function (DUF5681)